MVGPHNSIYCQITVESDLCSFAQSFGLKTGPKLVLLSNSNSTYESAGTSICIFTTFLRPTNRLTSGLGPHQTELTHSHRRANVIARKDYDKFVFCEKFATSRIATRHTSRCWKVLEKYCVFSPVGRWTLLYMYTNGVQQRLTKCTRRATNKIKLTSRTLVVTTAAEWLAVYVDGIVENSGGNDGMRHPKCVRSHIKCERRKHNWLSWALCCAWINFFLCVHLCELGIVSRQQQKLKLHRISNSSSSSSGRKKFCTHLMCSIALRCCAKLYYYSLLYMYYM